MSLFRECPNCHESIGKTINICPFCRYNFVTQQIGEPRVTQNMPVSGERASVSASASTSTEKVIYCSQCGTKLSQDAKFCHSCGNPITQDIKHDKPKLPSNPTRTEEVRPATTQSLRCPQCGRDDRIQKVSAIVASQTREISGGSWQTEVYVDKKGKKQSEDHYVPYSGTEMSTLAQRLSAPVKPDAGSNSETIMWAVALLGIAGFCGCLVLGGYTSGPGAVTIPIVSGILGIVIWISSNANHQRRVEQIQRVEMPRWEKAMTRWNKLYYCSRDGSIFIPSENETVPTSQMTEYLYR